MLKDKDMANDCLSMLRHGCTELTKFALESSNTQLRSTLTQMRNSCEQTQQQFSQTAIQKGWYMPSPDAPQSDITKVKSFFQGGGQTVGVGSFTANTVNDRM